MYFCIYTNKFLYAEIYFFVCEKSTLREGEWGSKAMLARINGGFGVSLPAFYGYLVDETPEANLASDSCDGKLVDTNFE